MRLHKQEVDDVSSLQVNYASEDTPRKPHRSRTSSKPNNVVEPLTPTHHQSPTSVPIQTTTIVAKTANSPANLKLDANSLAADRDRGEKKEASNTQRRAAKVHSAEADSDSDSVREVMNLLSEGTRRRVEAILSGHTRNASQPAVTSPNCDGSDRSALTQKGSAQRQHQLLAVPTIEALPTSPLTAAGSKVNHSQQLGSRRHCYACSRCTMVSPHQSNRETSRLEQKESHQVTAAALSTTCAESSIPSSSAVSADDTNLDIAVAAPRCEDTKRSQEVQTSDIFQGTSLAIKPHTFPQHPVVPESQRIISVPSTAHDNAEMKQRSTNTRKSVMKGCPLCSWDENDEKQPDLDAILRRQERRARRIVKKVLWHDIPKWHREEQWENYEAAVALVKGTLEALSQR